MFITVKFGGKAYRFINTCPTIYYNFKVYAR